MSDYSRQHDFNSKTGTTIFGSEVDEEFDALVTAVASKVDESREGSANGIATLGAGSLLPAGISGDADNGGGQIPEASLTSLGGVELATSGEATTGTDALRAITPATLKAVMDQNAGILTDVAGLSDPGADRIGFWDDSASAFTWLTAGTGVTITGTTMSIDASGVDHDSLSGFVANEHIDHSAVSVIAGSALDGGGTIDGNVTLNVDISGLTAIEGSALAATDLFLVDDGANGTNKKVAVQDMGMRVQLTETTQTLAAADMNSIMEFTGTATLTLPLNSGVDLPVGVPVVVNMKHATQELTITAATGVTLVSVFHPAGTAAASDTVRAGGTALLYKTADDVWVLTGDISD